MRKEEVSLAVAGVLFLLNFLGFISGTLFSFEVKDGCTYPNIAAYTNIGYIASCELFRMRFK